MRQCGNRNAPPRPLQAHYDVDHGITPRLSNKTEAGTLLPGIWGVSIRIDNEVLQCIRELGMASASRITSSGGSHRLTLGTVGSVPESCIDHVTAAPVGNVDCERRDGDGVTTAWTQSIALITIPRGGRITFCSAPDDDDVNTRQTAVAQPLSKCPLCYTHFLDCGEEMFQLWKSQSLCKHPACRRRFILCVADDIVNFSLLAPLTHCPTQAVVSHSVGSTRELLVSLCPTWDLFLPCIRRNLRTRTATAQCSRGRSRT